MIDIQRSDERGRTRTGWLDSRHSFSFGQYWNPDRTGFGPLVVLNEDRLLPDTGFGPHPHRNMEILTLVLDGELRHRDSLGFESSLPAWTVQAMRAGTGIVHSEWNASSEAELRFIQIWLQPRRTGLEPGYAELRFDIGDADTSASSAAIRTIASGDGRDGSLTIDRDAVVSIVNMSALETVAFPDTAGRRSWLQVLDGSFTLGGQRVDAGDGAALLDEEGLAIRADTNARAILFDVHDAR